MTGLERLDTDLVCTTLTFWWRVERLAEDLVKVYDVVVTALKKFAWSSVVAASFQGLQEFFGPVSCHGDLSTRRAATDQ